MTKVRTNKDGDHYRHGIETVDYIMSWDMDFPTGNIIKYATRYLHKGSPLADLRKVLFYTNELIAKYEAVDDSFHDGHPGPSSSGEV